MALNLAKRQISRISATNCVFLQCDIQERFENVIYKMPMVIKNTERMTRMSKIFGIPVIATEQYTKAFGHTFKSIQDEYHEGVKLFEKNGKYHKFIN